MVCVGDTCSAHIRDGLSLAATFPSFVFNAIFYCDALELQLFQQVPVVSARSADIKINSLSNIIAYTCSIKLHNAGW